MAAAEFPCLLIAGPQFGVVREREQGGWEILYLEDIAPQQARDEMLAPRLRKLQPGQLAGTDLTAEGAHPRGAQNS